MIVWPHIRLLPHLMYNHYALLQSCSWFACETLCVNVDTVVSQGSRGVNLLAYIFEVNLLPFRTALLSMST